tara:strand:+ start:16105 stop:16512 length:408 start_codon:yes stop_codon:yes gene_type:complete
MTRIYFFKNSESKLHCKIYKSKKRVSIYKIIAYTLDKEKFLKRDFFIERFADRFGLLSPILSDKDIIDLIIIDGIKIANIKILFFDFILGRNFLHRFFIAIILLIKPSMLTLQVFKNNSQEGYKEINSINSNITD